jgi:hypothetical protein
MRRKRQIIISALILTALVVGISLSLGTIPVLADFTDWTYTADLEVENNASSALPAGYTVELVMDTASLIAAGQMQAGCADLRISFEDGVTEVELDRLVEGCNSASTTITFQTQAEIATAGSDPRYRLHYGNPAAANPPQEPAAVYSFYDDFEDGDAAAWSAVKGTWAVVDDGGNYVYRYTGDGATWALSHVTLSGLSDLDYVARMRADTTTNWIGLAFRIQDQDNFMTFYQSRDVGQFKRARIVNDSHTIVESPVYTMTAGTWHQIRVQAIGSQLRARIWEDGTAEPTTWLIDTTDSQFQTESGVGLTLHYHNTVAEWDDVQARHLVDVEPTVALHWGSAPWWDSAWGYRQQLTVTNNDAAEALPVGYSVQATIDTGVLIGAGQMLGSCDDLRVVSFDGASSVEIDRIVEGCGVDQTAVWFALERSIPAAGEDINYYVYYGNPAAGVPPADETQVFIFYEDWEQGTAHWTSAGGLDPADTGTMGTSEISTEEALSPSHSQKFPQKASGGDAYSGYIPVSANTQYAIGVWGKSATSAYAPVGFDPYDSVYTQGAEVWLWTSEWTVPPTWSQRSASFTTGADTAYIKIKSEWWSAGPGTEPVYFDNLFLRYAASQEPAVTAGEEETILPVPVIVSVSDTGPVEVGSPITVSSVLSATEGTIDTVILQIQSPETTDVGMSLVAGDVLSGTWEANFLPAEGGTYSYRVLATASTGRSKLSAAHTFTATDTQPPQISLDSIVDPILIRDTQTLTVTVTDNGRVEAVTVDVEGSTDTMTSDGDQYAHSWRVMSVGTLAYTVTATDTVGNAAVLVGTFESQAREVDVCLWKDCKSGAASFSMDDGNTSCRAELEAAGFRGTYYYNGSSSLAWFADYSASGHEVASHSVGHPCDAPCCSPDCTPEAIWECPYTEAEVTAYRQDQIEPNIAAIEAGTGIPVVSMAWPCGCADARRMTAASYYYLGVRGYYDHIAQLEWVEDVNEPTPEEFMNLNSGASYDQTLIDRAIAEGKWAIITSHGSCAGIDYMGSQSDTLWLSPVGPVLGYIYIRDAAQFANYNRFGRTISFDVVHTLDPFVRQQVDGTPMSTIEFDDPVTLKVHVLETDEVLGVEVDGTPVSYTVAALEGTRYVLFDAAIQASRHVSVTLGQPAPTISQVIDSGALEIGGAATVSATVTIEEGTVETVTLHVVSPTMADYPMALVPGTTDTYATSFVPTELADHTYQVSATNDEGRASQSALRTLHVQDTTAPAWQAQGQAHDVIQSTGVNTLTVEGMDVGGLAWAILHTDESGSWQAFTYSITDWWDHGWAHRRPVTVTESAGLTRTQETIELIVSEADFPGLVDCAAELRVADGGGNELPVQVYDERTVDGTLTCQLLFQADVGANAGRTYYVYYGNPAATPPSYSTDLTSSTAGDLLTVQSDYFDLDLNTDTGVVSRLRLPAGGDGNLPLSSQTDRYWGWHQVCSDLDGNITGQNSLCTGGTLPATGLSLVTGLDGPIARSFDLVNVQGMAIYTMTFRFFAGAPYYRYDLVRSGTTASVMNNFWYANGNFARLGASSGGTPSTVYNTYSYGSDQLRVASFDPVDYATIDGSDNDGTDLGGPDYEHPSASGLSLYVATGATQSATEEVLARVSAPLTAALGPVQDAPEGQYGSPIDLSGTTSWTSTAFTWHNDSLPGGTNVQWRVEYCDVSDNCIASDVMSFQVDSPTAVEVLDFSADADGRDVVLAWRTVDEQDLAGFNLYRSSEEGGPYTQLNASLIPAQNPAGWGMASYVWRDVALAPGVYYYRLEDVSISDVATLHAPVSVDIPYFSYLPMVIKP